MSMYEPIRDAFHELNRLMIDKQAWDAEHERRLLSDQFQREQTRFSMQTQSLKNEVLATQAEKAKQTRTPRDFSILEIGSPDVIRGIMENPKAQEMMIRALDDNGEGLKYSPADGTFRRQNGSVAQFSDIDLQHRAPAFAGILKMYNNKPLVMKETLVELYDQRDALKKKRSKAANNHRAHGRLGTMDKELASMNAVIGKMEDFLNPSTGQLLKYYSNRGQQMRAFSTWAAGVGADELAQEFGRAANENMSMANTALRAMITSDNKNKTGKKKVTIYAMKDGVKRNGRTFSKGEAIDVFWDPADGDVDIPNFSTAKPSTAAGSDPVSQIPQFLVQAFTPNNQILPAKDIDNAAMTSAYARWSKAIEALPPANKAENLAAQRAAAEFVKGEHRRFLAKLQRLDQAYENDAITEEQYNTALASWQDKVMTVLGYLPTKKLALDIQAPTKK